LAVVEHLERELEEIRELLRKPEGENLAAVNQKLEDATRIIGDLSAAVSAGGCDSRTRAFFLRLPRQMAGIRALLEAAHNFFCALQEFRAVSFGAYERDGELRALIPGSRTLAHL
jgi:hypothetical protein